jgi:hypothetical protein
VADIRLDRIILSFAVPLVRFIHGTNIKMAGIQMKIFLLILGKPMTFPVQATNFQ